MSTESKEVQHLFDRIAACKQRGIALHVTGFRFTDTRGAATAGFEGLLVPAAQHAPGRNVVIFPQKLRVGSAVEAIAAEDLPPHPSRWRSGPA